MKLSAILVIGLLAVGVLLVPRATRAQQPARMRRVGVLIAFPEPHPMTQAYVTAFVQALARCGWVEGKHIQLDYRFAAGDPALFQTAAADLVGLAPDALLASTAPAVLALRS
jgi:ABC-type uncharacterized transport system substrate-binding protein